jgi:serine/threonine protein phosphatase PrpC
VPCSTVVAFVFKSESSSTRQPSTVVFLQRYEIGVSNIPGVDFQRPQKVNQDAWFQVELVEEKNPSIVLVGVLDGHGLLGHQLSDYFAHHLPLRIQEQLRAPTRMAELEARLEQLAGFTVPTYDIPQQEVLANAFHEVHWNAMVDPEIKTGRNGATCIACLVEGRHVHVACVGDSRAICLGHNNDTTTATTTTTTTTFVMAEETTVGTLEERERIERGEGTIAGENVFYGPVGVAMTRALGDAVLLRAGVVPTPVVQSFTLDKGDIMIIATDGVWGVLSNDQVAEIVRQSNGPQEAAQAVSEAAKKRWIGDLPIVDEVKMDDITTLVFSLV